MLISYLSLSLPLNSIIFLWHTSILSIILLSCLLPTLSPEDWLRVSSWARNGPSVNPKIFSEPSYYLYVLSSAATRDGGLLSFLHLGMAKNYHGRIKVCFKLEQKKNFIHTKKLHFSTFLSCSWLSMTFWAFFQGNGWEISHLKAEVGIDCPIIPSLRSRDTVTLALPRCQTVTQALKLRLWHQKTRSLFSLSPSCCPATCVRSSSYYRNHLHKLLCWCLVASLVVSLSTQFCPTDLDTVSGS